MRKNKKIPVALLLLFVLITMQISCTKQKRETLITDRELYLEAAVYNNLPFFPNTPSKKFNSKIANRAHGDSIIVRVNAIALASINAAKKEPFNGSFAEGALIVKEVYTNDGKLDVLAVMKKKNGAAGNNWLWAEYEPGGNPRFAATYDPHGCTGCHNSGKDNVRIFEY